MRRDTLHNPGAGPGRTLSVCAVISAACRPGRNGEEGMGVGCGMEAGGGASCVQRLGRPMCVRGELHSAAFPPV